MSLRETISSIPDAYFGPAVIVISWQGFWILSTVIAWIQNYYSAAECPSLLTPETLLSRSRDKSKRQESLWKFRNILVSLVHSSITGCGAVLCFWMNPSMAEDLIGTFTKIDFALITFSLGYFVYDSLDMLFNQLGRGSYELLLHHVIIFFCFGLAVVKQLYVGYAVVALLLELNSVFLHMRQLMAFSGIQKKDPRYRINSIFNIGTYVVFRVSVLAWMTRWIVLHRHQVPLYAYSVGSVGLALTTLINIVLFCRLIYADFIRKSRDREKTNGAAPVTVNNYSISVKED